MQNMLIDNELLKVDLPNSFKQMSAVELQVAYGINYPNMWGVRDESHHMMLVVFWKDSSETLTKFVSEKSLAKRAEKALARRCRKQGYQRGSFFERQIANRKAQGFSCSYQVQDVSQACETLVFKCGKRCYTLYYYTQPELVDKNRPAYDAILSSLTLPQA